MHLSVLSVASLLIDVLWAVAQSSKNEVFACLTDCGTWGEFSLLKIENIGETNTPHRSFVLELLLEVEVEGTGILGNHVLIMTAFGASPGSAGCTLG